MGIRPRVARSLFCSWNISNIVFRLAPPFSAPPLASSRCPPSLTVRFHLLGRCAEAAADASEPEHEGAARNLHSKRSDASAWSLLRGPLPLAAEVSSHRFSARLASLWCRHVARAHTRHTTRSSECEPLTCTQRATASASCPTKVLGIKGRPRRPSHSKWQQWGRVAPEPLWLRRHLDRRHRRPRLREAGGARRQRERRRGVGQGERHLRLRTAGRPRRVAVRRGHQRSGLAQRVPRCPAGAAATLYTRRNRGRPRQVLSAATGMFCKGFNWAPEGGIHV